MDTMPTFPRRGPSSALRARLRASILRCAVSRTVRRIFILVVALWNVFAAASRMRRFTSGSRIAFAVFSLILAMVSGEWCLPLFHALLPLLAAPIFARRSSSLCSSKTRWKHSSSPTNDTSRFLSTVTTFAVPLSIRNRMLLQLGHRHPNTWCFCCCFPTTNPPSNATNTGSDGVPPRGEARPFGRAPAPASGSGAAATSARRSRHTEHKHEGSWRSLRTKKPSLDTACGSRTAPAELEASGAARGGDCERAPAFGTTGSDT
mmetsp:Transcript_10917/g.46615  ORF Transcript_10917/g.46615 Transcript_10917/m.46615 type:complete len:262 (-) Transcript_10917:103-888(-)